MKLFGSLLFLLFSCLLFADDIPTNNLGEKNMIIALRNAINNDPILQASSDEIIIGAGTSGGEAFQTPAVNGQTRILLTWQWLDCFDTITAHTILVVPQHALDARFEELQKNKHVILLPILGVLHTKTLSEIRQESLEDISSSTQSIVMLAGDTQQEDGSWKSYNKKMLLSFLKDLSKDQETLILNGPRTGKYIENTQEIDSSAHKTTTDYITLIVQNMNIPKWKIIDFRYGKKSYWNAALKYCLEKPNTILILPGESTSMICEALSLGILPVVYEHNAMSVTSRKYVYDLETSSKILTYPQKNFKTSYVQIPEKNPLETIKSFLHQQISLKK